MNRHSGLLPVHHQQNHEKHSYNPKHKHRTRSRAGSCIRLLTASAVVIVVVWVLFSFGFISRKGPSQNDVQQNVPSRSMREDLHDQHAAQNNQGGEAHEVLQKRRLPLHEGNILHPKSRGNAPRIDDEQHSNPIRSDSEDDPYESAEVPATQVQQGRIKTRRRQALDPDASHELREGEGGTVRTGHLDTHTGHEPHNSEEDAVAGRSHEGYLVSGHAHAPVGHDADKVAGRVNTGRLEAAQAHAPGTTATTTTASRVVVSQETRHDETAPVPVTEETAVKVAAPGTRPGGAPDSEVLQRKRGIYALTARDIDGQEVSLSRYAGKISLVVNVASACGYTDTNYKGLQATYDKYRKYGLEVLAFPCNQFGRQESGSEQDIKHFCSGTYHVTFPMFSKIDVNGEAAHPVFKFLKRHSPMKEGGGGGMGPGQDIKWNFEKFLVNQTGWPVKHWASTWDGPSVEQEVYKLILQGVETAKRKKNMAAGAA